VVAYITTIFLFSVFTLSLSTSIDIQSPLLALEAEFRARRCPFFCFELLSTPSFPYPKTSQLVRHKKGVFRFASLSFLFLLFLNPEPLTFCPPPRRFLGGLSDLLNGHTSLPFPKNFSSQHRPSVAHPLPAKIPPLPQLELMVEIIVLPRCTVLCMRYPFVFDHLFCLVGSSPFPAPIRLHRKVSPTP